MFSKPLQPLPRMPRIITLANISDIWLARYLETCDVPHYIAVWKDAKAQGRLVKIEGRWIFKEPSAEDVQAFELYLQAMDQYADGISRLREEKYN